MEVAKESILAGVLGSGCRVRITAIRGVLAVDMLLFQNTPDNLAQTSLWLLLPHIYRLNTLMLITQE